MTFLRGWRCKFCQSKECLLWSGHPTDLSIYQLGLFQEPKLKEEFISPEELKKREEALANAKAWEEASEKTNMIASSFKIRETVSIAPEDSKSI